MKHRLILSAALIFSVLSGSCVNLKEAIAAKQIAVEVTASQYESMPPALRANNFTPSMQITVSNLSSADIEVQLEPGYMLEPAQPGYQAMLLVQAVKVKIKPNQRQLQYLYAMCTQHNNSGPFYGLTYSVGEKAIPALLQMALFIDSNKYLNSTAQNAVWSISDNMPVTNIVNADKQIEERLQKATATIKGINYEALKTEYEKRGAENLKRLSHEQLAEFNGLKEDRNIVFTVPDTAIVSVGFYDYNGNLIKPVFTGRLYREGQHSIRYNPYPLALVGHSYKVRMIKDGSLYREYYFAQ